MNEGRGKRGNREVSPVFLLSPRGDLNGAWAEACPKEGGSWGKHGFAHGSEPKASDVHTERPPTSQTGPCVATGYVSDSTRRISISPVIPSLSQRSKQRAAISGATP